MNKEFLKRFVSSVILLSIVVFVFNKGAIFFNFLLILCFLISIYEWRNMTKNKINIFIGGIFLIFSYFSIYQFRYYVNQGDLYLFLILAICILTDLGGYFFGKIIKGPKLTKISPNKTYSGMLGSFIFPVFFIYFFLNSFYEINYLNFSLEVFMFIIIVSTVSQLGDIIISYYKRGSNLKDTGKIIPGHGGLLDRIDGIIFAFPFSYLVINLIEINIIQ